MPYPDNAVIFISYRRTDAGWPAEYLADKLETTFGRDRVFLDVRNIDAGDDFTAEIESNLRRAVALIVLIGKSWLIVQDKFGRRRLDQENDWVRQEIRRSLEKKDCKVIPLLLDGASLPDEEEALPKDISELLKRQRIEVRQTSSEADINVLIKVLEKIGFPILIQSSPTLPKPDVRVKTNLRLISGPDGELQRLLSIKIENHSPLSLFIGNIELKLKDGRLLYVPRDSVTGEFQKRRKLSSAKSFTFNIAPEVIARKVNPNDLVSALITDDISRVYESDESEFRLAIAALFGDKS